MTNSVTLLEQLEPLIHTKPVMVRGTEGCFRGAGVAPGDGFSAFQGPCLWSGVANARIQ